MRKQDKLIIRKINKNGYLSDRIHNHWMLLMRVNEHGDILERKVFFFHATDMTHVGRYTHYIILPTFLKV